MALVVASATVASADAPPVPGELAPGTMAVVSEAPGDPGKITLTEFRHELELESVAEGRRSPPRPGDGDYGGLRDSSVSSLLETAWIYGQAVEWGISVSPHQVMRRLAAVKREFKSAAEYRRFLRKSHYTRSDVRERIEIQLLAGRLQARLVKLISRQAKTKSERRRAFSRWLTEFETRWRARTVCASGYVTERCSNGPTVV